MNFNVITFKHSTDKKVWTNPPKRFKYNVQANLSLKRLVFFIGALSNLFGWGPIVVTSYWRPDDTDSYHSILQAADIRLKDKPNMFKMVLICLKPILKWVDLSMQIYLHQELWGKLQEHIHLAYKNGAIKRLTKKS